MSDYPPPHPTQQLFYITGKRGKMLMAFDLLGQYGRLVFYMV